MVDPATILLLALLLCSESINQPMAERFLMAETVLYRAEVSGQTIEEVVFEEGQYPSTEFLDRDYETWRAKELRENIYIAASVLHAGIAVPVSNFARTGTCMHDRPCAWEADCETVTIVGEHTFYHCPWWRRPDTHLSDSFTAGVEFGCYCAIARERELGGNLLTGADCEAILEEYENWENE